MDEVDVAISAIKMQDEKHKEYLCDVINEQKQKSNVIEKFIPQIEYPIVYKNNELIESDKLKMPVISCISPYKQINLNQFTQTNSALNNKNKSFDMIG